jgi:hypothetical protein
MSADTERADEGRKRGRESNETGFEGQGAWAGCELRGEVCRVVREPYWGSEG